MKSLQLFISLFMLNLLYTTFIHLQLSRPFLPMGWEYTASGACSVGCSIMGMFIEIFLFTVVVMIPILTLEFILSKIGIKRLYRAKLLTMLYLFGYYFITHIEESFCEITQMYDAYVVWYGIDFLVAYGLFYWFMKEKKSIK